MACSRLTIVLFLAISTPLLSADKDSILTVIVNKSNPIDSVSRTELRALLLGEVAQWPNKQRIILVERESTSQAFQKTLQLILRMSEGDYQRWLLQAEFRGEKIPLIKTLNSNEGAGKFVFNVPGAIGVTDGTPGGAIWSDIKILRVDGKLPGDPAYAFQ